MRLPNGYGSVVKLSGNRRRPYMVRVTTGYDKITGAQVQKPVAYFAKKTEALAFLATLNKRNIDVDAIKLTFAQVHDRWKTATCTDGKEESKSNKAAWKWLAPLHNVQMAELKTDDFQKLVNACPRGYGTKASIKTLCNSVTKYAMANDIVYKNYAEYISLPSKPDSKLHTSFADAELQALWDNAQHDLSVQAVLILCYTGLRTSEFTGLKKSNIDLDKKTFICGLKTEAGRHRIVPIADKIFPFFKDAYDRSTGDYLYVNNNSRRMTYNYFRDNIWQPAMDRAELEGHLPHDSRHTCATLMDNAEVNRVTKKFILGHSNKDVTERVYTHKTIEQLLEAINSI